ncbi:hypothetical protein OIU77_012300 [Salix suchowensis]|uniref:Uncharacterized protein n=1 Tax=Salix suchowensis TaxID=1278906 RepID=A0ABQ9A376_9ROSI|nr:hypothetical protein OIU77_012300 [Salix suchowensis]
MLSEDPNLLPHRDAECSGSTSFGSYSGYFGAGKNSDLSSSGLEIGMNGILDELNGTGLQLAGQYPYLPGSYNLNFVERYKIPTCSRDETAKKP